MPDRDVNTIKNLIYYQYAKIIAKRAFDNPDGVQAKQLNYGFIKQTFNNLKSGRISWSSITREDWQMVEARIECSYCKSTVNLHKEHIIPKSIHILKTCENCPRIQNIHNQIWSCRKCNLSKGTLGLYEFFRKILPEDHKFYDKIPTLVEKKYLKTIYHCHNCANTLQKVDLNGDGEISVLDIDWILHLPV